MAKAQARYYYKRFNNDEDFHNREVERIKEFRKNKYLNDEEYRNIIKQKALEYYYKKKAEKGNRSSD